MILIRVLPNESLGISFRRLNINFRRVGCSFSSLNLENICIQEMIIKSFDLFEFDLEKLSPSKCILGITIGGLVLVKYFSFDKNSELAIFPYPNNKRENFRIITKERFNRRTILTGTYFISTYGHTSGLN